MNTIQINASSRQKAWLLMPVPEAANDDAYDVGVSDAGSDCISNHWYTTAAKKQAVSFGLPDEIAAAIVTNGCHVFGSYQTRRHFLSHNQAVGMRHAFGKTWRDSFASLVLITCTCTGRVVAIERDTHPKTSARKARGLAVRGGRLS